MEVKIRISTFGVGWALHEFPLLSDTLHTCNVVMGGEVLRMSRACRKFRADNGMPDTRSMISPI